MIYRALGNIALVFAALASRDSEIVSLSSYRCDRNLTDRGTETYRPRYQDPYRTPYSVFSRLISVDCGCYFTGLLKTRNFQ